MYTDRKDDKESSSKTRRKKSDPELIREICQCNLHQIIDKKGFKITSLMFDVLRADPTIKSMSRTDTSKIMVTMMKSKSYARASISSMRKLMEKFDTLMYSVIADEKSNNTYQSEEVDQIIRQIIFVIKADLQQVYEFITIYVDKKEIESTAFYSWLNETFVKAMKHSQKWYYYLSMNGSLEEVVQKSKLDIIQWLIRQEMGFDYESYRRDQERRKDKEVSAARLKNVEKMQAAIAARQNTFLNAWEQKRTWRGNKSDENDKQYYTPRPSTNTSSSKKEFVGYKVIIQQLDAILKANGKSLKFNTATHCAFWNHRDAKCKFTKEQCTRAHKCMNCEGDHILESCPNWGTKK